MLIEKTVNIPYIHLSLEESKFEIIGNSYSDRADNIFAGILEWIDSELPKLQSKLNCVFYLSILNSVTYKNILNILKKFEEYLENGKEISVNWYYDRRDEDNLELANEINKLYNISLNIIEKHAKDKI